MNVKPVTTSKARGRQQSRFLPSLEMVHSRKFLKPLLFLLLVTSTYLYLKSSVCPQSVYEEQYSHEDIAQRFVRRRDLMRRACEKAKQKTEPVKQTIRSFMFRLYDYNLTLCSIPKCGWTTWVENIKKLNGRHPLYDERRFRLLREADDVIIRRVRATATLISVRHPLVRLASAFRNKFLDGRPVEKLTTYMRAALHALHLPADRDHVTFAEFLLHVIHTRDHPDRHWSTYRALCSPCYFDYDFVAHLETYSEDMHFLAHEFEIPLDPEARRNAKSTPGEDDAAAFRYYQNVSLSIRRQIFNIFKDDMEMFGYEVPDSFWVGDEGGATAT
ncbi:carbohydrate sulfotransferase 11-like [Penaeus japonicus]|uniref:carbohydrate sulfotransferase 11-like n=1 Tax=Penaeus japonicus TaxID=27405 RepID=UPI001C710FA0|nr:carbohydrate sulfotransferase 11-like [Penaeus japonicus]